MSGFVRMIRPTYYFRQLQRYQFAVFKPRESKFNKNYFQTNHGKPVEESDDGETKLKRSEVETKTIDTNNLKPGTFILFLNIYFFDFIKA